jgi:hypothetical protein
MTHDEALNIALDAMSRVSAAEQKPILRLFREWEACNETLENPMLRDDRRAVWARRMIAADKALRELEGANV